MVLPRERERKQREREKKKTEREREGGGRKNIKLNNLVIFPKACRS